MSLYGGKDQENEAERSRKAEIRNIEFLAVGQACKVIFSSTSGSKAGTLECCERVCEGSLISASAMHHYWRPTRKVQTNGGKFQNRLRGRGVGGYELTEKSTTDLTAKITNERRKVQLD